MHQELNPLSGSVMFAYSKNRDYHFVRAFSVILLHFSATGSSHHRDGSWDVESTTSSLHTESTDRSAFTVNGERTSQFLADSVTRTNSATKNPVSQTEISVSSRQTQFPSQTTWSRGRSTATNFIQIPDTLTRTVLTHSYLYPNTGKFTCP